MNYVLPTDKDLSLKDIVSCMSFSPFPYCVLKRKKMHEYFFYLLQGTLIVLLYSQLCSLTAHTVGVPGIRDKKQCTMVNSNYYSSFTLSRLFAQSPNSSDPEELSRECNGRQLQMCSPQNHFYLV